MVLLEELEDIETTAIQLGFALPIASKPSASSTLLAHLLPDDADPNSEFPSKVGGIPNWLNPLQSPSSSDLSCGVCANPMALITQIFTPEDTPAEAYHRVIYLFCCRNGKCHKEDWTSSFIALRQQLPEINPHFPPTSSSPLPIHPSCTVCGLSAPFTCSLCRKTHYCSKAHQRLHWSQALHKTLCQDPSPSKAHVDMDTSLLASYIFRESTLVSEEEPDSLAAKDHLLSELDTMMKTMAVNQSNKSTTVTTTRVDTQRLEEEYEKTETDVDDAFLKFQKRVSRAPSQILRYVRVSYSLDTSPSSSSTSDSAQDLKDLTMPLWCADSNKLLPDMIPPCPSCSGPRTFEFQIMPQILNHLGLDHSNPDSIDFGALMVYSCQANCQLVQSGSGEKVGFAKELVWRQMFSMSGMQDKYKNPAVDSEDDDDDDDDEPSTTATTKEMVGQ